MTVRTVVLVGGSGFIGSRLAQRLASLDVRVLILTRHARHAAELRLLPQVELIEADVLDAAQLTAVCARADALVNLVGVLHSPAGDPYGPAFARAHVELPRQLVAAARAAGLKRLIHISALGADAGAPSAYQRSKAAGEAVIRTAGVDLDWTIFRPSVVFGPHDQFLNLFARLLPFAPVFPLGGAQAGFQPVFVDDVVEAICHALFKHEGIGEVLELAGPRRYTLAELVRYVARLSGRCSLVVPLPEPLAMLQAACLECLPGPLMSRDNVLSMRRDNFASGAALPFGLQPTVLEQVAPQWLGAPTAVRGRFNRLRQGARRN
ncbi:complex I NDUFA9 subunit family protein [Uliginosibacterium sediminicola]|uniref:Complex I NDUFA9 subunit family protein n=1 Tax=Uliginosibacterium sediminicola TaxID=2024550 RepID=A0ABU9YU45_9RHOO